MFFYNNNNDRIANVNNFGFEKKRIALWFDSLCHRDCSCSEITVLQQHQSEEIIMHSYGVIVRTRSPHSYTRA